jgi:hypothetical protein
MDDQENESPEHRGTMLTIGLTALFGGGFFLFLIFITGGFFIWVAVAVLAIIALGSLHYLVWGRAMTESTADEREEEELREQAETADWPLPESRRRRRF